MELKPGLFLACPGVAASEWSGLTITPSRNEIWQARRNDEAERTDECRTSAAATRTGARSRSRSISRTGERVNADGATDAPGKTAGVDAVTALNLTIPGLPGRTFQGRRNSHVSSKIPAARPP